MGETGRENVKVDEVEFDMLLVKWSVIIALELAAGVPVRYYYQH